MISKNVLKFILGLKIKQIRQKKSLSLKELGKMSGLSVSYLNEIEKGKKYPSIEKLTGLAGALELKLEDLVSVKTGRNLHPLLKFLESDLVKRLPLDLFGLSEQDMIDLMAGSPEKFANFVVTVLEVSRSYDMKIDDLYKAALRAYIESHDNYFADIEKKASEFKKELGLNNRFSSEDLVKILTDKYGFTIDSEKLNSNEVTENLNYFVKWNKKEKIIYLNQRLLDNQKKFFLSRFLGNIALDIPYSSRYEMNTLKEYIDDYKLGYFSGAFILEENELASALKNSFSQPTFEGNHILSLLESFDVSTEAFFHRLTQILTHYFGIKKLFFLRCNSKLFTNEFYISKELHLGGLHSPHGVHMDEHYCRRWVTLDLIRNLKDQYNKDKHQKLVDAQISIMQDGNEYFCLSIARPSRAKKETLSCLTIGMKIDEQSKSVISFFEDRTIKKARVGQTCERCSITDCEQRVAPAWVYNKEKKRKDLLDFLETF